ncbi:MAG: phosphoribosylformylglycinamidine cyclo-ligase, partial [Propionibacteriaceae bacterium]|nr:phosphoribosylformylglycinamidine cyclo-ligase [Propionibacteriaceae bacterium]
MGVAESSAYAAAGVSIEAGDRAVELMKASVAKATRPEVIGSLGGFAGLFDAAQLAKYRHPLLATSTDGVGTKVAIAQAMQSYAGIGYDLVGMLIDDLVVVGAEPLFLTDYIACGKVFPERIAAIVSGIAAASAENNVALIGGETAEHPGLLEPDEFDVAGATTGVVEADSLLGPQRVRPGDLLLALKSSGLHSNGFSLVRHVLLQQGGYRLDQQVAELGKPLGVELLTPTKVYAA